MRPVTGPLFGGFFWHRSLTLRRFKCRQCNQFKIPAHFSNKEIKNYQSKKTLIPVTNGVTAGIRCRSCAGEQVHELQCEGPCGFKKPLDCFSKSQRRGGLKVRIPSLRLALCPLYTSGLTKSRCSGAKSVSYGRRLQSQVPFLPHLQDPSQHRMKFTV